MHNRSKNRQNREPDRNSIQLVSHLVLISVFGSGFRILDSRIEYFLKLAIKYDLATYYLWPATRSSDSERAAITDF